MDLQRTLLKDAILPQIRSVYIIDYYEGVRGLLESRKDFPYNDLFAKPRLRTRTEIVWSTDAFSSQPALLSALQGSEKEYYSYLLCKEIGSLRKLIETLKSETGGYPLSELLEKTILHIDEKSVYCGDDKVVLVNWGLLPRHVSLESIGIYRSGNFIGGWEEAHSINPKQQMRSVVSEDTFVEEEPSQSSSMSAIESQPQNFELQGANGSETIVEPDNTAIKSSTTDDMSGTKIANNEDIARNSLEDKSNIDGSKDYPVIERREGKTEEEKVEEKVKDSQPKDDSPKPKPIVKEAERKLSNREPVSDWAGFFKGFWHGLKFLIKKLWWVILILLLLLLALFGLKDCQGPISRINPFYNPLPKEPVIMPIEEGCVGLSEDGMSQVATDRLNILLEKENDDTMLEWAKAFKKVYPSSDYEIKYYNTDTYLLQIKVPSDQRLKVKNELNSKLPDFSFDVFEESVFQSEFVANDPALNDSHASWWIDLIGAKEAWDLTQGDNEVIVAVVDNGFDLNHPEFRGKIVSPYNVLTRNENLRPVVTKDGVNGHGTHVAATAVGNCNNGSGLLGIAPKCRLMPVQVANDNPEGHIGNTAVLQGVLYAINMGADVVNVSIGKTASKLEKSMSEGQLLSHIANSFREDEYIWNRIFEKAKRNNCIIVISAGNDNVISGVDPKKRNEGTLRVSAVGPHATKANFSNFGRYPALKKDYSTVSAPGVSIYSATPNGKYGYKNGTSMAAPIVCGTVALMRSVNNDLSAEEAINILQTTGTIINDSIGPMIHIGRAVNVAMGNTPPAVDCDQIKIEVKRLQAQIDSLSRLCPGATDSADTLKYDDVINDPRSLDGLWKSTTELYSSSDSSPVELYMKFNNLVGQLIIVNNGLTFTAPLKAAIAGEEIRITQSSAAISPDTQTTFVPYSYKCSADRKRNLYCSAKSATNSVSFNLVRIQ